MEPATVAAFDRRPWLRAYPQPPGWSFDAPAETLPEVLEASVRRFGARPALDFFGRRWTYAELGALVDHAAAGFRALGVVPGSRVGLCLPNTPFFVIGYFGALKAGGIVVNFNPLNVGEELAAQVRDSGCEIVLAPDLEPILAASWGCSAPRRCAAWSPAASPRPAAGEGRGLPHRQAR
jgi:long-chain acyl-CoA synthetase